MELMVTTEQLVEEVLIDQQKQEMKQLLEEEEELIELDEQIVSIVQVPKIGRIDEPAAGGGIGADDH